MDGPFFMRAVGGIPSARHRIRAAFWRPYKQLLDTLFVSVFQLTHRNPVFVADIRESSVVPIACPGPAALLLIA